LYVLIVMISRNCITFSKFYFNCNKMYPYLQKLYIQANEHYAILVLQNY